MSELAQATTPATAPTGRSSNEAAFYGSFATLSSEQRDAQALHKLLRELRLDAAALRDAVQSRLHAWATLPPEDGALVASAFDKATELLTPEQQEELYAAERDTILNALSYRQFQRLAEFVPWLRTWHVPCLGREEERSVIAPAFAAALAFVR